MQTELKNLLSQAANLHEGLQKMSHQADSYQYNAAGIRENAQIIRSCLNKVGNNRIAALSARDTRKVMAEMEEAVERLMEFLD
ncbi:hypothetical protein [Marinobacterium arenosum]|uniref:hypothetical protein n=1 Tax=Marinobacterium arenosum TaxID=2862496 RepID=UPI001C97610E|nr:hypothetical protein [Marinobacterium arenosum]MBY4677873.1 hypothetical protein [Marinobacterium arenosum]